MDCWWLTKIRSYCIDTPCRSLVPFRMINWEALAFAPQGACQARRRPAAGRVYSLLRRFRDSTPPPTSTPKATPSRRTPIFTTSPAESKYPPNTKFIPTTFACKRQGPSRAAYQLATRQRQRGREASRGDREDCAVIAEANTLSLLQSDARAIIGTATRRRKPS